MIATTQTVEVGFVLARGNHEEDTMHSDLLRDSGVVVLVFNRNDHGSGQA
jgi:hypothetical protein